MCPGDYRAVIARADFSDRGHAEHDPGFEECYRYRKGRAEFGVQSQCRIRPVELYGLRRSQSPDDHQSRRYSRHHGTGAAGRGCCPAVLPSNVLRNVVLPIQTGPRYASPDPAGLLCERTDPTKGKVRQIATCMKGNDTLVSQVDADIRVSSRTTFRILNSASHVQKDGPFTCNVTITPGNASLQLSLRRNHHDVDRRATALDEAHARRPMRGLN